MEQALFAAGCFWGVQHSIQQLQGVKKTVVGYTGGSIENPSYEDVCRGDTGHAEAVFVEYDPHIISYEELLNVFWDIHNPTQKNRQGPDIGTQYRSAIFYFTEEQRQQALDSIRRLQKTKRFSKEIVTEVTPASSFYPAEEYHQHYFEKNGITGCRI